MKQPAQSNVSKWRTGESEKGTQRLAANVMMELRKAAAHPLLLANVCFTAEQRTAVARLLRRHVEPFWDWTLEKVEWEMQSWSGTMSFAMWLI